MRCPECSYNQKVNRDGMTCVGCQYDFCFNPKLSGMTDGKFVACIKSASQNDTQWFTLNQLYAAFCRRFSRPRYHYAVIGLLPIVPAVVLIMDGDYTTAPYVLPLIVGGLVLTGVLATACYFLRPRVERSHFGELLKRWRRHGKSIDKLLTEPSLKQPPPEWNEPDIYDYGVERILIVERDMLVDLFVRNGFHAEQRMLVLSESGYPSYLAPIAAKLLEERADLPVFLLHDATAHGIGMEQRIRSGDLLPLRNQPLTDLGLFPADFQRLKRTKSFDVADKARALPVDALPFPFLVMGMQSAFIHGVPFSTLLTQQTGSSAVGGGSAGGGDSFAGSGGLDGDFG